MRRLLPAIVILALAAAGCSTGAGTHAGGPGDATGVPLAPTGVTAPARAADSGATGPLGNGPSGATSPVPTRSRFAGRVAELPAALAADMRGTTWHPGCPVPLSGLALLRFNYWGLDGEIKRGPLVVNSSAADDLLWVFRQLFEARYPFKRVGLAREFHEQRLEDDADSRRDVTASFNCRVVVTPAGAGDTFSQHAYGLAVDVNPLQNPFVRADGWVRNRFTRPYVDRSKDEPGMIHAGDVVVNAFAAIGWSWGGDWSGDKDYMHFSLTGT